MLICPLCQNPLILSDKTYRCIHRHSFDVAKEGYVNLHVVQHKKSKNPGDAPEQVAARRRFLAGGFYQPLKEAIVRKLANLSAKSVLDIGCGEGYYTMGLADAGARVVAIDIAKSAVQAAAKADKQKRITWAVGTGALLPVADGSVDVCTSFFSPLPVDEMARVLSDGGYVLVATPAPKHLYALREALFGEVVAHTPDKFIQLLADRFALQDTQTISCTFMLDNAALNDLICMTPYAFKAKPERRAALQSQESLTVEAQFCLYTFKKI